VRGEKIPMVQVTIQPPRAVSVRGMVEVRWKWSCAATLFERFRKRKDEEDSPCGVGLCSMHPIHLISTL